MLFLPASASKSLTLLILNAASGNPLNPLPPPFRSLEGVREILGLVDYFAFAEFHNAHGECCSLLIVDGVFRDPEVGVSENSPDLETGRLPG